MMFFRYKQGNYFRGFRWDEVTGYSHEPTRDLVRVELRNREVNLDGEDAKRFLRLIQDQPGL